VSRNGGHDAPVACAAATGDGRALASAGYDGRVILWDAERGVATGALRGHAGLVNAVDWAPDGARIVSAGSDHTARVWDARGGVPLATLRGHVDDVNDVRFSPDGKRVATASFDGSVRVWGADGACLLVASHHASAVNGVAWFPDGRRLAAASDDGSVSIFDADGGRVRRILRGHRDWVDHVAIHPSGRVLASASLDGTVGLWDAESGARLSTLADASCVVKDVAFSADGTRLGATSYDGRVRVYDARDFRVLETLRGSGLWNRTLRATPRGWLTGSFGGGPVLLGGDGERRFGGATTSGLNGFALSPCGRRALACCDDGRLYEIDLARRSVARAIDAHEGAVLCAAWSPDGTRFATGSWDHSVRVFAVDDGRELARWRGRGEPVNSLVWSADCAALWIGTFTGDVAVWEPATGASRILAAHVGSVKQLARRGARVFSVGRDGCVHEFDGADRGGFRAGESILNGVACAARSRRIATVSRRNGLELWSDEGAPLERFRGHACSAKSVAFSRDDRLVAAGYYDGHVAVFCPETRMARVERAVDASVSQVAFARDALLVSTWDARGTLHWLGPEGVSATVSVAA
jgi:WD40 repeat protein